MHALNRCRIECGVNMRKETNMKKSTLEAKEENEKNLNKTEDRRSLSLFLFVSVMSRKKTRG